MNEYIWLELPDHKYIPYEHKFYEEYLSKFLNPKELKNTMDWKLVKAIYPPEHYGLNSLYFDNPNKEI